MKKIIVATGNLGKLKEIQQILSDLPIELLPQSELKITEGAVQVTREIDGGQETLELQLPAVITADLRLNEPRYIKLPNLMLAKKKPLATIPLAELGISSATKVVTLNVAEPPKRAAGKKLNSVSELVELLRTQLKGN